MPRLVCSTQLILVPVPKESYHLSSSAVYITGFMTPFQYYSHRFSEFRITIIMAVAIIGFVYTIIYHRWVYSKFGKLQPHKKWGCYLCSVFCTHWECSVLQCSIHTRSSIHESESACRWSRQYLLPCNRPWSGYALRNWDHPLSSSQYCDWLVFTNNH